MPILLPNFVRNKSIENNAFEHSAYTVRCFGRNVHMEPFRETRACSMCLLDRPRTSDENIHEPFCALLPVRV